MNRRRIISVPPDIIVIIILAIIIAIFIIFGRTAPPAVEPQVAEPQVVEPEIEAQLAPRFLLVRNWKVVDGDTIEIDVKSWPRIFRPMGIRLRGINCPESRTSDREEKKRGLAAKANLSKLVFGVTELKIVNMTRDKFFRLDADVFAGDVNLAQAQVDAGHAIPWNGIGKRPK